MQFVDKILFQIDAENNPGDYSSIKGAGHSVDMP